ncbi:tetraacyldisaccharide 4'-kinase [Pontibacter harenae]|uniref:tetraacyldisaccharide 4'-kinase n=1 Tax=Pontibacter harenae TaxID=2894083 RepID=UPI001E4C9A1D|nr:tetraacyldisaccharide 4'-kinase [Pontibacter harenae]MCC9168324.1 tetraacyldisaccharide 4'-kinase [Pontibacter harenae]
MFKYLKHLLWPFSILYGGITAMRNKLYDQQVLPSHRFEIPVLAVGNLTVGGTGKTPHVEYLLRLLKSYKVATLSRGYKRQSKGFVLAGAGTTAAALGDEPFQYHLDFPEVAVGVSEDRVKGVQQLQREVPSIEVVLLDDAMQHRPIQPSFNILLSDYNRPFYNDFIMPVGLLRESKEGAKRADVVLVSKCPTGLTDEAKNTIKQRIKNFTNPATPVFFSSFKYGVPVSIGMRHTISKKIVLLTGIANAAPLIQYLDKEGYNILEHVAYADHYYYTAQDVLKLKKLLQQDKLAHASVLTTRKDAVKLQDKVLHELTQQLPIFYIPIEVELLEGKDQFDAMVLAHVQAKLQRPIS